MPKMGFAEAAKAVSLLHLSLLLCSFIVSAQILPEAALPPHYHAISPVMPPAHPPSHSHHHHHHHPHQPTPSPTKPPTHPPVHAPKPPTYAPPPKTPTKPPTHAPPPKPPTYAPPPNTPTKPPTHAPPPKPPTYAPPTKPPTSAPPPKPPVHPPTYAPPTKSPVHPPTKPPTYPSPPPHTPAMPPTYPKPTRSLVAVQGVVFCKSCKYNGSDTLLGATPVLGATVKLTCKNTKYKQDATAKTDKNGYFFLQAPKTVTSFGAHRCTVSLLSSPITSCSKPSNLHGGLNGASLRPEKPFTANKLPYILYTVGPFAFEPKCY